MEQIERPDLQAALSRLRGRRLQLDSQLRRAEAFLRDSLEKLGSLEGPAGDAELESVLDAASDALGAAWRDRGARTGEGGAPSILVVDLYDASRMALGELLRTSGYPVLEAGSSSDLPPAGASEPLLIVFDPGPHFDAGLRTVARMRIEDTSPVPVVLLSAITPDQRDRALGVGCSEVLVKPCAPAELLAAIGRVVGPPSRLAGLETPVVAHAR